MTPNAPHASWLGAHAEVASALIKIIPSVVAAIALAAVLVVYREDVRRLLPRVSNVEAFGLKLSLIDVKAWADSAKKRGALGVTDKDLKNALDRGSAAATAYQGARILWADDHPENNVWERRALTALGADVTVVVSNAEESDRLRRAEFDILISDLRRDSNEDAREIPKSFEGKTFRPAVLYYVLQKEDKPVPEAFGIATRPDELVQMVTDVLERRLYHQTSS